MGADRRIFQNIKLGSAFRMHYLDWLMPNENESIESYAKRMSERIDTSQPYALVGLSFGGVIACEISRFLSPEKIILVSSISTRDEIPWYYKLARILKMNKLPFLIYFKSSNRIFYWLLGAKSEEEKILIKQVKKDSDPAITFWAIDRFLNWQNQQRPQNIYHIHGTSDRILPIRFVQPDKVVKGGSHFMIFNMHQRISELIESTLK